MAKDCTGVAIGGCKPRVMEQGSRYALRWLHLKKNDLFLNFIEYYVFNHPTQQKREMAFTGVLPDADDDTSRTSRTSGRLADVVAAIPSSEVRILIGAIKAEVRCDNYDWAPLLSVLAEALEHRIQPLIRRSDLTRDLRRPRLGW